jgi:SPP1 gp7 family putative phage head morphogenesis protein
MNLFARSISLGRDAIAAVRRSFMTDFTRGLDLEGGMATGLRNPYRHSVWVQAAIGLVCQPIKSVSLKFYLGETEYEEEKLAAWWRKPAERMSYDEFLDATAGWLKLRGEFFWVLDDTWLGKSSRRSPFLVASPDKMRHVVVGGELLGWVLTTSSGAQVPLLPEQVIHEKRWDPDNEWRGLGEIEAARLAAETDFVAGRYARDTWANQGEGGEYISAKNGSLTDEQRDQVTTALRAKRAAKLRGDFRPLFFSSDIEVKSPTITPPDLAFAQNRLQSRHEVFIAFGVPASMADVQASYSIGSASDYFRLIHGTCIPVAAKITAAINRLLAIQTGKAIEAYFDFDDHPVMQQVRSERIEAALKLWGMGMPMKEINGYLDMGLNAYAGWETGYLPFSVQPTGTPIADPKPEPGMDPAEPLDDAVSLMIRSLKAPLPAPSLKALPAPQEIECGCGGSHASLSEAALKDGSSLWASHWRARQGTIKLYQSKFNRVLMEARAEVLSRINRTAKAAPSEGQLAHSKVEKAVSADFNFDLEEWQDGLIVEMNKAGRDALQTAGQQCFTELGKDDAWSMPPAKAINYLKSRENFFSDLADSIHTQIMGSLEEGLRSGDTMEELAGRIRTEFTGISAQRAMRIASTETGAAYGAARQEALSQSGIAFKKWLTSGNASVRPTHHMASGQIVKVSDPFVVGGAKLMHPSDGSLGAPPQEVINCHCVSVATQEAPKS